MRRLVLEHEEKDTEALEKEEKNIEVTWAASNLVACAASF